MLSLLSRAVANLGDPPDSNESPVVRSKKLLHKCLSQFTRQQQIHAQQAARYLRGLDDSIPSHKTIPMLSALLISYVVNVARTVDPPASACDQTYTDDIDGDDDTDKDECGEEECEDVALKILVGHDGALREANQVVDYLYRGETLRLMTFYDFCQCVRLEKTSTSKMKNTASTRLGVLARHELKLGHPSAETHRLVEHCYVRIRPDPDIPREDEKTESGGQLLTAHTRTRAGRASARTEETKDGRSRARGSERSKEPQRDTREEQVILVLRLSNTSTRNIYTRERMRRSRRRV